MKRFFRVFGIVAISLVLVLVVGSVLLLRSDFAREKVRSLLEGAVAGIIDGEIHIGAARGGLLSDLTLIDVTIKDSRGQTFVAVDTVRASYSLLELFHRRFVLGDVLLVRPVVLLDQKTGEQWNYARIFRMQSDTARGDTTTNNIVVRLDRVRLLNGDITLRSSWQPDSTLTKSQREGAIARALSDSSLLRVERVGDSYQMVQQYTGIYAKLPTVRIVDPSETTMLVVIDSLLGNARAFRGDAVSIQQAEGQVEIAQDSLYFRGMRMRLPGSLLRADGTYGLSVRSIAARVIADSVSGSDARHFYRGIPDDLRGSFTMDLNVSEKESHYHVTDMLVRLRGATAAGAFDATLKGASLNESLLDANLRVGSLDAGLVRELMPALNLKPSGVFNGTLITRGTLAKAIVDAHLTFDDKLSGRSQVVLRGGVGMGEKIALRDLTVEMQPVQTAIARNYTAGFPLDAELSGTAKLNGVVGDSIASELDVQLSADGHTSRIKGAASVVGTTDPLVHADVQVDPLDLSIVNSFVVGRDFRGEGDGTLTLNGRMSALNIGADLAIRNGGTVAFDGLLNYSPDSVKYNFALTTEQLNLATVLGMEQTSITSVSQLQGQGTDPGTLVASLDIAVRQTLFRDMELDSARVLGKVSNGVLHLDSLSARARGTTAVASGSLGITDSTSGALDVRVFIDSLAKLRRWLPADSIKVAPRPARIAEAYRVARADSARKARETEIQRLIDGSLPPKLEVKEPPVIPADSLAGSAFFNGRLTGNIARLDAAGELIASRLVAMGVTVDTANAIVSAVIMPSDSLSVTAQLRAASATAAGFAIDTVAATVSWAGGVTRVDAQVRQGSEQLYAAKLELSQAPGATVVKLNEAQFHFDSLTTWETRHPSRIVLATDAIIVDSLDISATGGGTIHAAGRLARTGDGNIDLAVYGIEVSHLLDVTQSDINMTGIFSGGLTLRGNLEAPLFKGSAGFVDGTLGGKPMPELHSTFEFAEANLKLDLLASRKLGGAFAQGTAEIPLDLARTKTANRLAADRPIRADFTLDSLPLELIPDITQNVSTIGGSLHGEVHVAGTINKPDTKGDFTIDNGSAYLNIIGVQLSQVAAHLTMDGDTVVIQNFTALSGGTVTLEGGLGLKKLNEPSFDLHLTAKNAYVLNTTDRGRLRADVDVAMNGPFLGASIEGRVDIINGVIYIPDYTTKTVLAPDDSLFLVVLDTTDARSRQIYQQPNPFLENLVVNIDLSVGRDTWARSADANVELFSDDVLKLGIKRASRTLSLDGVLSAERGQYTYFGKRFEVKRGSATFVGTENEINPILQITADHEVTLPGSGTVNISVVVGGTMLRPKISLTSDAQPPLSLSDMYSYLAFGHSSGSLLAIGASTLAPGGGLQGVGRVASQQLPGIALGVLMDELERAAEGAGMRRLGLDFLNIVPAETYTEIAKGDVISFLRQTSFEAGRYVNTRTYVAGQLRLSATPGIRAVHRAGSGYRVEVSWEPRLVLLEPTLSEQRSVIKRGFGLFLFRDWRF